MLAPVISFIVPYSERDYCPDDGRLGALLELLSGISQTEVVVHTTGQLSTRTEEQLTALESIKWVKGMRTSLPYSAGQARNEAVSESLGEYLFFIDIDLVPTPYLLTQLTNRAKKLRAIGKVAFEMFPCIYLNQQGTLQFDGDFDAALDSFLKGENIAIDGIALASSCLLVNRGWFHQLGGFDRDFVGHGGEDLSFIHQLCLHYPVAPFPRDYAENIKAQHPANYRGCRRYYSLYSLANLFKLCFLVHRWHPRPLTHGYHKSRAANDVKLSQKLKMSKTSLMSASDVQIHRLQTDCMLSDAVALDPDKHFQEWLQLTQERFGYSRNEYSGLFDWQADVKIKRPFWRKCRKLYLNPMLFFSDMFKKYK